MDVTNNIPTLFSPDGTINNPVSAELQSPTDCSTDFIGKAAYSITYKNKSTIYRSIKNPSVRLFIANTAYPKTHSGIEANRSLFQSKYLFIALILRNKAEK